MRVLVLGGTQFVGRHIAEALVAGGHSVTVFNRGRTNDELPEVVERSRGDRDAGVAGLGALRGRTWDACVDVSGYIPRQVRTSAEALAGSVGRYVFVSAVSVYGDPKRVPVDEEQPTLPVAGDEVTQIDSNETYGALKVACEQIVRGIYGDRCALLRPQIVVGPHEPGSRFTYWLWRALRGGEMLAPGDGTDHLQVIDAGDVGRFVRNVIENGIGGTFNLAGHRLTWREFMEMLGASKICWVGADVLRFAGVTEFEMPLYRREGSPRSGLMHVSNGRALEAGLKLTGLAETIARTRSWMIGREIPPPAMTPEREAGLIRMARRRS